MLATFALLIVAAQGVIQGDVRRVAVSLIAMLLVLQGGGGRLIALVGCLLLGEWAAAAASGVAVLCGRLDMALIVDHRKLDPAALSAAVGALPEPLHERLRGLAGPGPITTWHVIDLAHSERPVMWQPLLGKDPGRKEFDGRILVDPHGSTCTQFFAEAAAFGAEVARLSGRTMGPDVLAVAAYAMRPSLAHEWVERNPAGIVLQISDAKLLEGLARFHRTPAAAGFVARAERELELPDSFAALLTREQLAGLTRAQVVSMRIASRGTYVWAVGAVLWGGMRSLTKPLRRRQGSTQVAKQGLRPASSYERAKPHKRHRPRLSRAWDGLPSATRTTWLLARPALGATAIVAAASVDGASWWVVALVTLAVLLLRSLRTPVPSLVAAVGLGWLAPFAGLFLLGRVVVGEAALFAAGSGSALRRRATGVARVVEARRRLLKLDEECNSYADAHARFEQLVAQPAVDHDDLFTAAAVQAMAAWAEMRPLRVVRTALGLLQGGIFGQWEGRSGPVDFTGEFRHLFIRDTIGRAALRLGLVVLAAVSVALAVGPVHWVASGQHALAFLPAAAGALAIVVPASRVPPKLVLSALAIGAVWLVLPRQAVTIVAISVSCALAANLLRRWFERASLEGPEEEPWAPLPRTPRRARELWLAADEAARDGRVALAIEMLEDLAREAASSHPALAEECYARIALWQLEDGRLGEAAARLDRLAADSVEAAAGERPRMSAAGNYAVGMLSSHLGDDLAAKDRLTVALEQATGRPALMRHVALSLAEVHARLGDANAALRVLEANPLPRVGSAGMAMMIDREVVAASALDRGGDRTRALARIEQLTMTGFTESADLSSYGHRAVQRISSAEGRANLLGGRLRLEAGKPIEARPMLANAVKLLSVDADAYLRAGAQILYGRTLTAESQHGEALSAVQDGLKTLEERRLQISSAQRRTAMIVAGEGVYEHALATFERADRSGETHAGLFAFALVESLRRSAISGMLRHPRSEFRDELNELLREIDGVRDSAEASPEAWTHLARLVSKQFADAFQPSPVDPSELRAAARRNGHILAFYVAPSSGATWRGWMAPDGRAHIRRIEGGQDANHPLGRLREGRGFTEAEIHGPWDDCGPVWRELADALLPQDLRDLVAESDPRRPTRILVVPDGYLSAIPWGALRVDDAPLVGRALLQVAPTVDLAGTTPMRSHRPRGPVVTFAPATAAELLRQTLEVTPAVDRSELLAALDADACSGAYIGAHGEASGLDQRVQLGDGEWLSAAGALMHRWPGWVIFAACVVGRIDPRAGGEPLGLPISCMLGGSTSVIAAVVRITGRRADESMPVTTELFAQVGRRLHEGIAPAQALRAAQLDYLSFHGDMASVGDGLGAVCISTQVLTSPGVA